MFQFAGFASLILWIQIRILYKYSGFPHSDIAGSMLHCQLPRAFRRLARPSSPVIAKASTTCTYVLDPITLHPSCIKYLVRAPLHRWFTGRARRCSLQMQSLAHQLYSRCTLYLCLPDCQRTSSRKTQETSLFPQPSLTRDWWS